ncbi:MAG TPA: glycosyltransferase family 9 protein [Acetobacteraceae bacterium]|jgi:heptosyltransferase-2
MTAARQQRLVVVQPLPGIGDMVWHLPHIRALAEHAGGPVTLVAKPRSHADQIFAAEDTVADIIWMDRNPTDGRGRHDGPSGLWRLMRALRTGRFDSAMLLHHSATLALTMLAAGVPVRQGYGIGAQRWFLNRGPFLSRPDWRRHRPLQRATMFLQASGIPIDDPEPRLPVAPSARIAVLARLRHLPQPFVVLGIGSSEPSRQWGATRFAALAQALLDAGWPSLVLVGGPREAPLVRDIETGLGEGAKRVISALGWHLGETAALLAEAAFYAGNDTGVMNMAAAVGTSAYALFGTTPALHHSAHIVPILSPPGGPTDGTARITVDEVLRVIARDRGSLGCDRSLDDATPARLAAIRR